MSSGVPVHVRNVVDTTPPVVMISEPANGATLSGRNATINASATDNLAVSSMRLFIDGSLVASSSSGSLSYNWNLRKVSTGRTKYSRGGYRFKREQSFSVDRGY
ncbi:MAG: Ig-like domain-containing protein [Alphaproteobacteria bacterium]